MSYINDHLEEKRKSNLRIQQRASELEKEEMMKSMQKKKQVKPQSKKEYKEVIRKKEVKKTQVENPDGKVSVCLSRQQVFDIKQAMAKDKSLVELLSAVLEPQGWNPSMDWKD